MENILLITSFFPPDQHIGALRWAKLGKYLSRHGYKFYIITADNRSKGTPQNVELEFVPKILEKVGHPLTALSLAQNLKRKLFLRCNGNEVSDINHKIESVQNQNSVTKTLALLPSIEKFLQLLVYLIDYPDESARWGKNASMKGLDIINKHDIDLIIATHPFAGCLIAAQRISSKSGIPWIADMRDPLSADHQRKFFNNRLKKFEQFILKSANRVVTINEELRNLLVCGKDSTHIITNSFDPEDYKNSSKIENSSNNEGNLNIVYTGGISPNQKYKIFMKGLKDAQLQVNNTGLSVNYYGPSFRHLLAYGLNLNLNLESFQNHGIVPHQKALQAITEADLLLVFGWEGKSEECVMTGKVFEYLGTKNPIIAIDHSKNALGKLIISTSAGVVLTTDDEVKEFLVNLMISPIKVIRELKSKRNNVMIEKYSTPYTAKLFERVIESLIHEKNK